MKRITFTGVINPRSENLTLPEFSQEIKSIDTGGFVGQITVKVTASDFIARIECDDSIPGLGFSNLGTLAYSFESMFQTYINAASYINGREYNLELIDILDEQTGKTTNFRHTASVIEDNKGMRPFSLTKVLGILYNTKHSHRILYELNAAIGDVRDTGFHCYRAIEGIRQHFVNSANKAESWNKLKESLNFDQSYIKEIEYYAGYGRHGEIISFPPEKRDLFLQRTWTLVDRFFIFLDSGTEKLDPDTFPLLS